MKPMLAGLLLVGAALLGAAAAAADPASCYDQRLCESPSKVHYCPDTGQMVAWLAPCPALVVGPRMPGASQ